MLMRLVQRCCVMYAARDILHLPIALTDLSCLWGHAWLARLLQSFNMFATMKHAAAWLQRL